MGEPKLRQQGQLKGLRNEGFDPSLISQADVEDDSSLPQEKFDSILALGVFPHLVDENKALQNLKKRLIGSVACW